ncbi:stage III sporulation protein SpoIIIAB [Shimazuella alba]|uniref:Stage III sporulation protein AB n=1 Tax=Shimazuella alba TaxID=2690964 RepID=A0A6I4VU80_9BACL|nr:stage III sporulation protein SpoIIIAB [Shimazuella alba]MXQ55127.1 stage III sporulation protein AB [Shimazuella alba]
MLKLVGCILLLFATTGIGFILAGKLAARPKQIRRLISALSILETEIHYSSRNLSTACSHIGDRDIEMISELFRQMALRLTTMDGAATYECLKLAVQDWWPTSAMKTSEKEVFLQFCKTLGNSDRSDQLTHLALAKQNLQVEEQKAREEQFQYEKMVRTLGVLAGALLIILLY